MRASMSTKSSALSLYASSTMPNNAFKIYAIAKSKYSNSIEKVAIVSTDGINKTKCIENRLSAQ